MTFWAGAGAGEGKAGTRGGRRGRSSVLETFPCKPGLRKEYEESVLQWNRNEKAFRVVDRSYVT